MAHPRVPTRRSTARSASSGELGWERAVSRYVEFRRRTTSIGPGWTRRIQWELIRLPRVLSRTPTLPKVGRPLDFRAEHLTWMKESLPWSRATFRLNFAALRPFLGWSRNRVALLAPLWKVAGGEAGHRRWLTKEQLSELVRAARGQERLLIALEGLNGLRRVEVLRLRFRDVGSEEGFLNVRGKGRDGGKWRQVPICPHLSPLLARTRTRGSPEDRLIPLSASGADVLLHRAAARAGFPAAGLRVSHHDLRRTFGRLAHEAGMDLVQLKNLYGHASLDQTVHYIGLDQVEMRRGLDRLDSMLRPLLRDSAVSRSPAVLRGRGVRPRSGAAVRT